MRPPPLLAEVSQQLLAGVELRQLAGALAADELGVEGFGVALAPEHLRAVPIALPPAHPPDDAAVLALDPFDAHDVGLLSSPDRSRRKLPRAAGTAHLDDSRLNAHGGRRDPLVEAVTRDPQPRAQAHRRSSPHWIAR